MLGDVYKIVTSYSFLNMVAQNRYYYKQISAEETDTQDVTNAWLNDVYPAIQLVQSSQVALVNIYTINLHNPADFYETAVTGAVGDIGGEVMPPFVSWTFKLLRDDRTFRPGRKAIAGVPESQVSDGLAVAGIVPSLEDLADAFALILVGPVDGASFRPNLVREVVGTPPLEAVKIIGAQYTGVSTQNSRKFGKGI